MALGLGTASCSHPAAPVARPAPVPAPSPVACALSGDSGAAPDTLTIGVPGRIDPVHAPIPRNDAERLVFRQLYESLIRLDCAGQGQPALAESWASDDSGRRWTFTLRAGARFWDGLPVTARDVIASWTARDSGEGLPPATDLTAASDRTLSVRLAQPSASLPVFFADPALAVTRAVAGQDWPLGTGVYSADTSGGRVILVSVPGGGRPTLVLRASGAGGDDARDLLDAGVDLLVTDDPAALRYAAARPGVAAEPLIWDRTYVLLSPAGGVVIPERVRAGLAQDAVRVEARPATGPHWWSDLADCPVESPPSPVASLSALAYPRNDLPARDLAERLVALGEVGGGSTMPARAVGLESAEFAALLTSGRSAQYVLPLPRNTLDPCREVRRLVARAPWLTAFGARIVPLVDTRRRAVVRRGAARFVVDWDGTLRAR